MSPMIIEEVYDALKEAGASEEKARAAARAIANYETEMTDIRATLRLHSWMLGAVIGLLLMLMGVNLTVLFRLSG